MSFLPPNVAIDTAVALSVSVDIRSRPRMREHWTVVSATGPVTRHGNRPTNPSCTAYQRDDAPGL